MEFAKQNVLDIVISRFVYKKTSESSQWAKIDSSTV